MQVLGGTEPTDKEDSLVNYISGEAAILEIRGQLQLQGLLCGEHLEPAALPTERCIR